MDETIKKLKWHAGLLELPDAKTPSISDCTWLPNGKAHDVSLAVEDALHVLNLLNRELNGASPASGGEKAASIARTVVYAVNEMLRLLRQAQSGGVSEDTRRLLKSAEDRLWIGWNAVVAGDIDDVVRHVQEEEASR